VSISDPLIAHRSGIAGPALDALRARGCSSTLDTVPALWFRALDAFAAADTRAPGVWARVMAGAARLERRLQPAALPPESARHRFRWETAWRGCATAPPLPDAFLDLVQPAILDGARAEAQNPLRITDHRPDRSHIRAYIDDLNVFLVALLSAPGPQAAWRDLAASVLTAGPVPFARAARVWGPACAEQVAMRIFDHDASVAHSARALWPTWTVRRRAVEVGRIVRASPSGLQALIEVHSLLRAVAAGPAGHGATVAWDRARWQVVRALLVVPADRLVDAICEVPHLSRRSTHAAAHYGRRRAERARKRNLLEEGEVLLSPCAAPPPLADAEAVRTWVLLAVLRGQSASLRAWAEGATTHTAEGGGWQRVMNHFPVSDPTLRDPTRLRLAIDLDAILAGWHPWLEQVAGLPTDRSLRTRLHTLLRPIWSPAISLPPRGAPKMVAHAKAWLAAWTEHSLSLGTTHYLAQPAWGDAPAFGRLTDAPRPVRRHGS